MVAKTFLFSLLHFLPLHVKIVSLALGTQGNEEKTDRRQKKERRLCCLQVKEEDGAQLAFALALNVCVCACMWFIEEKDT